MIDKPKVLILDIETKPTKAYVWRMWKENISQDQIIEPGGMICFSAKWFGQSGMEFYSQWEHGQETMVRQAHRLLSECDAIVTYNGDKFDLPYLNTEFLLLRLPPVPPLTSIDVYKTVKYKFKFLSNRLGFIGPFLKVGAKIKNAGFQLWVDVDNGKEIAQGKMQRYCQQDVRLLERVYKAIRPYISNHPHLGPTKAGACGACSSPKTQSRGFRRTKSFLIQRIHCQACGAWQDGKRTKVT